MNCSTNWIYEKKHLEAKGLRRNIRKTKIMICGKNLHSLRDSGKHPCGVCRKGVGSNSTVCDRCQPWIHKKCSGFKCRVKADPKYRCKRCMGICRQLDGRPEKHVTLEGIQLYVMELFRYLGDKICSGGGCELATIAPTRTAWGNFLELLLLLISPIISLARHGKLYDSCTRSTLLHASQCWPLQREEVQHLLHNEQAILCWMLKIKTEDKLSQSTMHDWILHFWNQSWGFI